MERKPFRTHLLLLFCFFTAALTFKPGTSFTQNYLPFQDGHLSRFDCPLRNFSVRVDSSWTQGVGDLYRLNKVTGPKTACPSSPSTHPYFWRMGYEGRFGDHYIAKNDGSFHFVSTTSGDTAILHTQMPLNTPWNFMTNSSITAEITQRGQLTFFNVTDSVITIELSTGAQFQLSENYGLYSGLNLSHYFTNDSLQNSTLFSLPEVPDWRNFVLWQPGDYWTNEEYGIHMGWWDNIYRVTNRYDSPTGDTIVLDCWKKTIRDYGSWSETILGTESITYTKDEHGVFALATDEAFLTTDSLWLVTRDFYENSSFNNRLSVAYDRREADACGNAMTSDYALTIYKDEYTLGLGKSDFDSETPNMDSYYYTLECYRLGNELQGTCNPLLLPNVEAIEADLQVLTAGEQPRIRWEAMVAGDYSVSVWDLQGRRVWEADWSMQDSGEKTINTQLSNGVWLLRVQSQDGQGSLAKKFAVIR